MRNGANVRVLNLARSLVAGGHYVKLAGFPDSRVNRARDTEYLTELVRSGTISDFANLDYSHSYTRAQPVQRLLRFLGYRVLMGYPPFLNLLLKANRDRVSEQVRGLIKADDIDVVVLGERRLFFLMQAILPTTPVFIDFIDCLTLAVVRDLRCKFRERKWLELCNQLQRLGWAVMEERYYGRRSRGNFVVSPIDARYLARVTGRAKRVFVVFNGVEDSKLLPPGAKLKGRLIFTGNMDFAPNCQAAIWFIDKVLPLVLARRPDVRFVLAGANPTPDLLKRRSDAVQVLGFVDDISAEIAKSELYIAPLVSGGGFKNKVVEALLTATLVASTSIGVEFLPAEMRSKLLVADDPQGLAECIIGFLADPEAYRQQTLELQEITKTQFTWDARAEEFLGSLQSEKVRLTSNKR
jgi:glycosyltransferase involved in cell wall biosynthesis